MNLKAKRIKGDTFTSEDVLSVIITEIDEQIDFVTHSIEHVSGVNITHGGGGQYGEFLHYKDRERDSDSDGNVDYSEIDMRLEQKEKGVSVIKVVAKVITVQQAESYVQRYEEWFNTPRSSDNSDPISENAPEQPSEIVLKTGEISISWEDDNYV